ncbi:recombination regulator RecX [Vagococcus elongatus]|uniref:Regulatory protein RecX n=1 Tax=Vagococcus elongatus TaxID=180344 RepID=A0A430B1Q8_9ENTE|nr:recombination regulator RecX [Vagococcus elongatus]RSU14265.1 recombination regulator RecX [Vagococcus elongatus]
MEKIISVTKNKGAGYQIQLASGEAIEVSEDVLVRHRLLKGQEVSSDFLRQIKKDSQQDLGYQLSLNYLSYQLRTEKEVKDYLITKKIAIEDIPDIIQRLKTLKLVDDLVYGESYVRTQIRLSDKGPGVLQQQLFKKGLRQETVEKALRLYTPELQLELAVKAAKKSAKKHRQKTFQIQRQKVQQTLMTKGFSAEIIKEAMALLALEKDEAKESDLVMIDGEKIWQKNKRFDFSQRKQKTIQGLIRKGFDYDLIQEFLSGKESDDE